MDLSGRCSGLGPSRWSICRSYDRIDGPGELQPTEQRAGLADYFQDEIYLQVIKTSGEGSERKHAANVLGLLKRGKHWVLVTLLLGNVITNETLPIVLDRSLGGGWPAVLGSTVLIGKDLPDYKQTTTDASSYLRRNYPSVYLRPIRSTDWRMDVSLSLSSNVHYGSRGMANRKAAGQTSRRRPWNNLQKGWAEDLGDTA